MNDDYWKEVSQELQEHRLVVEASMSGLRAWIPPLIPLIELVTHAWLIGTILLPVGALNISGLGGDWAIVVGGSLMVAGTIAIIGIGLLHLMVEESRVLRKLLGQQVSISMHSVTARGRTIPLEEITGFTLIKRVFMARWLYAQTRDGRRVLLAHNDDKVMMEHLRDLLEERRQARVALLSEAGHDVEASVRPPAALEALRGEH